MFGLGTTELIIILVIIMMIFGLGKLPKVMGQLGKGVREFKDTVEGKGEEEEPARLEDQSANQVSRDAGLNQERSETPSEINEGKSW